MGFISYTITVPSTGQRIVQDNIGASIVKQITISVRSMGTATYVGIGNATAQTKRLIAVGDAFPITPNGTFQRIDISGLYISSDTSDAVVEIIGEV